VQSQPAITRLYPTSSRAAVEPTTPVISYESPDVNDPKNCFEYCNYDGTGLTSKDESPILDCIARAKLTEIYRGMLFSYILELDIAGRQTGSRITKTGFCDGCLSYLFTFDGGILGDFEGRIAWNIVLYEVFKNHVEKTNQANVFTGQTVV
jgi:hypothetical protein